MEDHEVSTCTKLASLCMFCGEGESKVGFDQRDLSHLFETIDDDNIKDFMLFFKIFATQKAKILSERDEDKKTLLHRACEEGRIKIVEILIEMMIENNMSLEPLDSSKCTPLDLACIQGFDRIEHQFNIEEGAETKEGKICTFRYFIVKKLLEATNPVTKERLITLKYNRYRWGVNCPLHWAIYWADYDLAELIIKANPKLLFYVNKDDCGPLDMSLWAPNRAFYYKALLVVDYLLDLIFEVLWNSNEEMTGFESYFINKEREENNKKMNKKSQHKKSIRSIAEILTLFFMGDKKGSKQRFEDVRKERVSKHKKSTQSYTFPKIVYIVDETRILSRTSKLKMTYYIHRIANWYAYFGRGEELSLMMERYHLNPFKVNQSGKSIIHVLAEEGRTELISQMLSVEYRYLNEKRIFSLDQAIMIPTTDYLNSPMHLAAMKNHQKVFQTILEHDVGDVHQLNQRCIKVIDLAPKSDVNKLQNMEYWEKVREGINRQEDGVLEKILSTNKEDTSWERLTSVTLDYDYAIIIRGDVKNIRDSIVFQQMLKIHEEFAEENPSFGIKIDYFAGYSNRNVDKEKVNELGIIEDSTAQRDNYYILLLKPTNALYCYMADQLDFKLFNTSKGFRQVYVFDGLRDGSYEPLKHYQKHKIIVEMLHEEFNINKYMNKGFIIDHFPIHNFTDRKNVAEHLKKYFWRLVLDPLVPGHRPNVLVPLIELGLYHGLQNGYYFGFLTLLTTYMIPLGTTGLVFYLYALIIFGTLNSTLMPVFCAIISIWSTLFFEAWMKRENELAFAYDVHDLQIVEEQRTGYLGRHHINEITKKIEKYDFISSTKRRILVAIILT